MKSNHSLRIAVLFMLLCPVSVLEAVTGSATTSTSVLDTRSWTLAVSTPVNGSIQGAGEFLHGASATLTAAATPGYRFAGWIGASPTTSNPLAIQMLFHQSVGATFVPDAADSDGDGVSNYDEISVHGTDPNKRDTDDDGLDDGAEIAAGLSATVADMDGDGWSDGAEVEFRGDPRNPARSPVFEVRASIAANDQVILRFPGVPGKNHSIQASDDMKVWLPLEEQIEGLGKVIQRNIPRVGHGRRFFKIRHD